MTGLRVLVADDQALIRTGLRTMLETEPDLAVVAEAEDGAQAVRLTADLRPDVVLLDIRMPVLDGLEAARRILADAGNRSRVLMLTTFDLNEYVYEALRIGASGFLLKDTSAERLVEGIRAVASGEALLAPAITRRLIEQFTAVPPPGSRPPTAAFERLTPRELEVFGLVARGLSNHEIATELFLGETTVKTHVARVLMKLELRDRIQAVVLAYESGVVRAGS